MLERQTNKVFVHPLCLVIENFKNPIASGNITLLHLVITYTFVRTNQIEPLCLSIMQAGVYAKSVHMMELDMLLKKR